MLMIAYFIENRVCLPLWVVFCDIYSFSNEVVCGKMFFSFFG